MNIDAITNCPVALSCFNCDSDDDLKPVTLSVPVGVCCMTLCVECRTGNRPPYIQSWPQAVHMVLEHCGHLGIDADQMADVLN